MRLYLYQCGPCAGCGGTWHTGGGGAWVQPAACSLQRLRGQRAETAYLKRARVYYMYFRSRELQKRYGK